MNKIVRSAVAASATLAVAAGLVCVGASSASAAKTSLEDLPTLGRVVVGPAPGNRCKAGYVDEDRSFLAGYRITARCDQLADFTKARAVNNYPARHYVTTDWSTYLGSVQVSAWKKKTPLADITRVEMEYGTSARGLNVHLPGDKSEFGTDIKVAMTTAPDEQGNVAVYWRKNASDAVKVASGKPVDGRVDLTIPGDAVPAGVQEIFGVIVDADGTPVLKTKSRGLSITKAAAPISLLRADERPVALERGFDLAVKLPSAATGTVTLIDADNRVIATAEADRGKATLHAVRLPVGEHSVKATYGGDSNYLPATSTTTKVDVVNVDLTANRLAAEPGRVRLVAQLPDGATGRVRFQLVAAHWRSSVEPVTVHDTQAVHVLDQVPTGHGPLRVYAHYLGDGQFPAMSSEPTTIEAA